MERQRGSFHITSEKNQETERKYWVDLPQDTLALILRKLHFADQIRFRAVCKSWRISEDRMRCSDHLPWVMNHSWMYSMVLDMFPFECEIFDPHSQKVHKVSNSVEKFKKSCSPFDVTMVSATKQGWLLIGGEEQQGSSFFMHNPFTNEVILLPHLAYEYSVATFSANPASQECEIFVLCHDRANNKALYIGNYCLSRDKEWSTQLLDTTEEECFGLQYMKGKLYCLFEEGMLKCYNLADKSWELLTSGLPEPYSYWMDRCWLIETEGNLIMAWPPNYEYDKWYIFRFDWSHMSWAFEPSLKNMAFFISGKISLSAPLIDDNAENTEDCRVVFIDDKDDGDDCGINCYSLTEGRQIQSQEYGWIKRSYCKMSFIEPPYIRN
ncbi:hypothetical protein Pfo_021014 [Paulownia fortunei]|nr:hypothetical protein Pfo_021014 [Paulownia fortunei]